VLSRPSLLRGYHEQHLRCLANGRAPYKDTVGEIAARGAVLSMALKKAGEKAWIGEQQNVRGEGCHLEDVDEKGSAKRGGATLPARKGMLKPLHLQKLFEGAAIGEPGIWKEHSLKMPENFSAREKNPPSPNP